MTLKSFSKRSAYGKKQVIFPCRPAVGAVAIESVSFYLWQNIEELIYLYKQQHKKNTFLTVT